MLVLELKLLFSVQETGGLGGGGYLGQENLLVEGIGNLFGLVFFCYI